MSEQARQEEKFKVTIAIFGDVQVGKTSLFSTLDPATTITIDAENGMKALGLEGKASHFTLRTDATGKSLSDAERPARLMAVLKEIAQPAFAKKYKTVFLDTMTEVGRTIYSTVSAKHDGFKLWGAYNKQLLDVVVALRDLGHYDIVLTCGEKHVVDDVAGLNYFTMDFASENARKSFRACMDEVYRMVIVDGVRKFATKATPKTHAKNRLGGLDPLEDADLSKVLKKLKGAK